MTQPERQRRVTRSDRVKIDSPAYRIVEAFGGLMNFCDATGFPPSTVHAWLRSGLIPAKWHEPGISYQRHIIESGAAKGVVIDEAQFIEGKAQ